MAQPRVLVLRAPGTNCDQETAFAFEQAGGSAEVRHVFALRESPRYLEQYEILCIPGGFSYGDDLAAGRLFALELERFLADSLHEFVASQKLVLGICNGFQTLLKSGLLAGDTADRAEATLTWNHHGRYEDRWVYLRAYSDKCVFLKDVDWLYLPIAHAEGRFVARDDTTLDSMESAGRLALRYAPSPSSGDAMDFSEIQPFPANPNGSQRNVAGICDETGRVFGMMPHPERHIDPLHHPRWTREDAEFSSCGRRVFENAVSYFG